MKLGYLLLRLTQRCWGMKGLRSGLTFYPPCQAEIGAMAGVALFSAVAVGFTTLAGSGSNGPATKITNGRKLMEEIVFLDL